MGNTSVFETGLAKVPFSNRTLSVRAIDFRVQSFVRSLDPDHRADVARRARFYTLPWLRRSDALDDDMLP